MEFFLKKNVFKRILIKRIAIQLCASIVLLILLYLVFKSIMVEFFYIIAPFVILYEFIKQIVVIVKMKKEWDTYRILLSNDNIYKTQYKKTDITIMRDHIRRVVEIPNSGLSIQTYNEDVYLYIPVSLENYKSFRNEIAKWCLIEESPISEQLNNEDFQFKLASHNKNGFSRMIKKVGFFLGAYILIIIFVLLYLLR